MYCELNELLDDITLLNERGLNGLIICDYNLRFTPFHLQDQLMSI